MRRLERLIQRVSSVRKQQKAIILVADCLANICTWNTIANTCTYREIPSSKLHDAGVLPPDYVIIVDDIPMEVQT